MASTKIWMKFFLEAGIPEKSAVQYAISFEQNRMDMNMLMDLDKEYLRDLKITALGDIISILKHAKVQHERLSSDRVLNPEVMKISPTERSESKSTSKIPQESNSFSTGAKTRPTSASVKDEDTGQNIHTRLGPLVVKVKEEASSSVFERLGAQAAGEVTMEHYLEDVKSSSSRTLTTPKTGSIFGRLGPETKDAKPQESQVSSSSDPLSHGILKTKKVGVGKTKSLSSLGLSPKSLSISKRLGTQTNIISLKKTPAKEMERKRVSFGGNEVKDMSTGVVSTMAHDVRPKSPANMVDLRAKLDHENKKVMTRVKTSPSCDLSNLVIRTRPSPITAPASSTCAPLKPARIKPPGDLSVTSGAASGGVKARIGTTQRIKPPPIITSPATIVSRSTPPTVARSYLAATVTATVVRSSSSATVVRSSPAATVVRSSASATVVRSSPSATVVRSSSSATVVRSSPSATVVRSSSSATVVRSSPAATVVRSSASATVVRSSASATVVRSSPSPRFSPVTTPGAPVRTTVHLNPKMIKLQTSTSASTSSKGSQEQAKTSVKSRIGEKNLQVKLSGEKLERSVARPGSPAVPAKTTSKRSINQEKEIDKEDLGTKPKKKRLVMIKTKADGTKTRHVIQEDDPILQKVTVTKIRKTASSSSLVPSSSNKSLGEVEEASPLVRRRNKLEEFINKNHYQQLDEDTDHGKDSFKVKARPVTSSTHQTLAGKAMELAVRDEKRAFQGGGLGDKMFQTLANRAKAASRASLSRNESSEEETDLVHRRDSEHRIRRISWDEERLRLPLEEEIIRPPMEEGRTRRISVEERLSIEEERMRKITMEEEKLKQKLAEHNERTRRLVEEEQRGRRKSLEEERSRRIPVEESRYDEEDVGRGRVFQRLGGKQRY